MEVGLLSPVEPEALPLPVVPLVLLRHQGTQPSWALRPLCDWGKCHCSPAGIGCQQGGHLLETLSLELGIFHDFPAVSLSHWELEDLSFPTCKS